MRPIHANTRVLKFLCPITAGLAILIFAGCGSGLNSAPTSSSSSSSSLPSSSGNTFTADIVVYGATPSGVTAAVEAAHLNKSVYLLEPSQHVGGMMSSGLGNTDVYAKSALGGLVQTFFQAAQQLNVKEGLGSTGSGTRFAPHIAEGAFNQLISDQNGRIRLIVGAQLQSVSKTGTHITSLQTADGRTYVGTVFIDASYEGDLMAGAGVSYTVGRESTAVYGESFAGVAPAENIGINVDPYIKSGDPSSGLLPLVSADSVGTPGSGDSAIMAYNYRLCFSSDPNNQIHFAAPANYDPATYEAVARQAQAFAAIGKEVTNTSFMTPVELLGNKYDVNSGGYLTTDMVGSNFSYPDASYAQRKQIADAHKVYIQGLLYFLMTDPRIPVSIHNYLQNMGLCKDEFTDNGGWPRQLYVREARRMLGAYIMTQRDGQLQTTITDSIGLGGFPFDSHHVHRFARNGRIMVEGRGYPLGNGPYPISYRALTPKGTEADNLLVSVAVSASHVAIMSLRIEVTYMVIGQAAGAAAAVSVDQASTVQNVDYNTLRKILLADSQALQ